MDTGFVFYIVLISVIFLSIAAAGIVTNPRSVPMHELTECMEVSKLSIHECKKVLE